MKKNTEEVWYCVNSKGHKIPPYETTLYNVEKPKRGWERFLNIFGSILGIAMIIVVIRAVFFL